MYTYIFIYIYRVGEVKQWSRLLIRNCYHQTHLHGACFGLLDCQIILVCTEPWVVSSLVLFTFCHLQCRCHCFEMLPF